MRPEPDCKGCPLCEGRTNVVYPDGDPSSKVVLVGEAPGENEDLIGRPFVGRAGKILDNALAEAGVDRKRILITNTVKCRPPNNRDPTAEEMAACRKYLESELCNCSYVVCLGRSAIKDLMGIEGKMETLVNTEHHIILNGRDVIFIPAYHPMACIYRKSARASLKETMSLVKNIIG